MRQDPYRYMLYYTAMRLREHGFISSVALPITVDHGASFTPIVVIYQTARRLETWKKIIDL